MAVRVVIIGAGEAGRMLVREISAHASDQYDVVGFLDDDPSLAGRDVAGLTVLGPCDDLPRVVAERGVEEAIVSVPSGGRDFVRRIISLCRDAGVAFRIVPGLLEIVKGPVRLEQIRDVHPEDLLGRESVDFDEGEVSAALAGRAVLVTGAGGSIGGEICRQLGRLGVGSLALLGRGENQIFEIEQELAALYPTLRTESVIVDIRDPGALERAFRRIRPEFVYHAAAHKHVHYMEAYPEEAVKNNIVGTANVIDAAGATDVDRMVMLSTDKAVNPRGAMGASKRFAEYLMVSRAASLDRPRLVSVRFGNVLASRGSVVPLFVSQIRRGGPVTVSDEGATRFFMSLREACMLVVHASMMGRGGEVFILKMGKPIRIAELARDLITLHGFRPDIDIPVSITGMRPGEKLHEDLTSEGEQTEPSAHPSILRSTTPVPDGLDVDATLQELERMAQEGDAGGIRRVLSDAIPDADLTGGGTG